MAESDSIPLEGRDTLQGEVDVKVDVVEGRKARRGVERGGTFRRLTSKWKWPETIPLTEVELQIWKNGELVPTDAFGKIKFVKKDNDEFYNQNQLVEYVRLDNETEMGNLIKFLKEDWGMQKPELLMSVTGGAKKFECPHRKDYFKGIVEAATKTDAWIITGGTNGGVMKYIGQAVRDHRHATGANTVALGIATWGTLTEETKKKLTRTEEDISTASDDKRTRDKHAHMLNLLREGEDSRSLRRYLQPVKIHDEKGQSQEGKSQGEENARIKKEKIQDEKGQSQEGESQDPKNSFTCSYLEPNHSHFLLVDGRQEELQKGKKPAFGKEIQLRGKLEGSISKDWEKSGADDTADNDAQDKKVSSLTSITDDEAPIPVVCVAIEGGTGTIHTVYEAVTNDTPVVVIANTGRAADVLAAAFTDNKEVTETDDRWEFIKEADEKTQKAAVASAVKHVNHCLKKEKRSLIHVCKWDEGRVDITQALCNAMTQAKSNRHWEQLMLALKWKRFDMFSRTFQQLGKESRKKSKEEKRLLLRHALVENMPDFVKLLLEIMKIKPYLTDVELLSLYDVQLKAACDLEHIDATIRTLTGGAIDIDHKTLPKDEFGAMQKLFLYAVLNNFDEMAYFFWTKCREAIPSALAASKIYKSMASLKHRDADWRDLMRNHARSYEDRACGILTCCHDNPESCQPSDLLIRILPNWGNVTCLDLAESAHNLKFVSHPVAMDFIKDKWHGDILKSNTLIQTGKLGHIREQLQLICCSFLPFLIPFLVKFQERGYRGEPSAWQKIRMFYSSPRNIFRHNIISYILFVILFSYNLLWEDISASSGNLSWSDWLLFLWMISFATEEIREMAEWEAKNTSLRLKGWWSEYWNKLDFIALVLFLVGTVLRFTELLDAARIILASDLFILYFRFLEYLTMVKNIGPKVLMIGKMFIDLLFFLCIMFIILLGYGIAAHVILYPHVTHPPTVFESILYRPYFQIYGELFLEDIEATQEDGTCTNNMTAIEQGETPCPAHSGIGIFLLAFYLLISNVLLLNLLIAMFSNTFSKVQEQTDLHWRFQRYSLTKEYVHKPMFVPPLSIISHVAHMALFLWFVANKNKQNYLNSIYIMRRTFDDEKTYRLLLWEENKATHYKKQLEPSAIPVSDLQLKYDSSLQSQSNESKV